ncbi:MAG TPA: hypothetical protein VGV92_00800 [Gammaproteobacteria bacterium]|nr:hypothetical protein [Gammaproteobacteria bacterium]
MDPIDQLKKEASSQFKKGTTEVQKSAKDWYGYIEKHPLQSMLFGTVVYFAVKGLLKD